MWKRRRKDPAAPSPHWPRDHADAERAEPDEPPSEVDRRLHALWEAGAPDEPTPDVWAGLLARIESDLAAEPATVPPGRPPGPAERPGGGWGRLLWRGGLAASAAAAVLLFFLFGRGPRPLPVPAPDDAWEVLAPHEVSIVSIEGDDSQLLVVGRPPIQGPIVLMEPGDVIVQNMEPHPHDGMVPDLQPQGSPTMLIAPLNWGDR